MQVKDDNAASAGGEKKRRLGTAAIIAVILVGLAAAAYANSVNNRALFHHVPNPFGDPVLDNTMLRSYRLFPKIFTSEFLLASYGEYRPLGYALFALINGVMPQDTYWTWHLVLIAIHLVSAALVFLTLRMLVRNMIAAGLAATYLVHPMFVPVVNDVNVIYLLWGLLFSITTVYLFLAYLKTNSGFCLLLSILVFGASVFTYRYAAVVPAFLIALYLLSDAYPRCVLAMLVYLFLASLLAGIFKVPALVTLAGLSVLVVIVHAALAVGRERYYMLIKTLLPYLVLIGLFWAVSASMETPRIFTLVLRESNRAGFTEPFQPWFAGRQMLAASKLHIIGLALVALMPGVLFFRKSVGGAAVLFTIAFLLACTVRWNSEYRDDMRFWESVNSGQPGRPALEWHLASAYAAQGNWEGARDILMQLKISGVEGLLQNAVDMKLGRVYAEMGDMKCAGFLFFDAYFGTYWKIMKNSCMEFADYCFRTGYLSYAENRWASGLVIDPYDIRLYNNLGKVLIYKNFFRGAAKHFRYVLWLDPDNPTALYHLAFIADVLGDQRDYEPYRERWRKAVGGDADIDFQRLFSQYRFDREKMLGWFSGDPLVLFMELKKRGGYTITFEGKTYEFSEIDLEVAEHCMRRGLSAEAVALLDQALEANPKSRETIRRIGEAYRRLEAFDKAKHCEQLLETP